ncbi:Bug family tripartite tricarboxylate transporter substrate binding protein [Orrella sp. 11846]|uniref:Bug family tripartite tricarboxylate transporter substrate binding protein n=1 Tax=Orrella sp. 11846 TaxID=3409913 RepID=UPI003B5BC997
MMKKTFSLCILAASLTLAGAAHAAYPEKPVTIVVPFPAGQTGDLVAREVGEKLSKRLGQPFVIDNRGGAGGQVGTAHAARAKNDGYTLLMTSTGPFAIAPSLYSNLPYNSLNDFVGIADAATTPQIIAVPGDSEITDIKSLVEAAKKGDMTYASAGAGSTQHLTMELLKQELDIDMLHVPFKGSAESKIQVVSGLIPVTSDSLPAILPQLKAGQLKGIAIVDTERSTFVPDIPTYTEQGYAPISTLAFFGLVAPAGTPKDIVDTLNKHMNEIMAEKETQDQFAKLALTAAKPKTTDEFNQYIHDEVSKWKKVIDNADAKIN